MEHDVTLYNGKLFHLIQDLPSEVWGKSETELRKEAKPTLTDYELKIKLWAEIERAESEGCKVQETLVYRKVCSEPHWHRLVARPHKLAWLMAPLVRYEDRTKALLTLGTTRYADLLNMDISVVKKVKNHRTGEIDHIKTDEVDPRKASVLLATIKNLEDRVRGAAIQKSININASEPKTKDSEKLGLNIEVVNKKIKELENQLDKGLSDGQTKRTTTGYQDIPCEAITIDD